MISEATVFSTLKDTYPHLSPVECDVLCLLYNWFLSSTNPPLSHAGLALNSLASLPAVVGMLISLYIFMALTMHEVVSSFPTLLRVAINLAAANGTYWAILCLGLLDSYLLHIIILMKLPIVFLCTS